MADDKKPIHGQSSLCDHLLRSVSSSSVPLRIGLSSITNAGSGLFVGEKVPAGTEIFRSEPLLLVCDDRNKGTCDYCFRDNNSLVHPDGHFFNPGEREDIKTLACTRCKCAQYCSKDCQALAWKSYHKYECALLKDIKDHDLRIGALPLALCRLLFWMKKKTISEADLSVLTQLETHGDDRYNRWLANGDNEDSALENTFSVAQRAKDLTKSPIDIAAARQLYCVLVTNAAAIVPAEVEIHYGDCLDLLLSLINHSCSANAHVFFEGRQLRCRALQDIPAGGEIMVHYCPHPRQDVLLRRKFLSDSLFITCRCNKCKEEMAEHVAAAVNRQDHLRILQTAQYDFQNAINEADAAFNSRRVMQICTMFQKKISDILERGYPGGRWPKHLHPLPAAYQSLGSMYFELQYMIGLEFVLKGTLYKYAREGRHMNWARELLYLTKYMAYVAQADDDDIKWTAAEENAALLDRATMRTVARGYACIVSLAGKFAFGMDSRFVRALYLWAGDMMHYPGDANIHTEVFRQRFGHCQERLLTWARMQPDEGLDLPSVDEIDGVTRGAQAFGARKTDDIE